MERRRKCEACGEKPTFLLDGKWCIECGGYGSPCERCQVATPASEMLVWEPPDAMAFACTGTKYDVCRACMAVLMEIAR